MTIRISGKGINVGEALRERVSDRTEDVLRKYFEGNYSGHFTIGKDKAGFRADCALHLDSGITLEAEATAPLQEPPEGSLAAQGGGGIGRPRRTRRGKLCDRITRRR